jgi:hypothetical protein
MSKPVPPRCWENKGTVYLNQILDWCLKRHHIDTLLVTSRSLVGGKGGRSFSQGVDEEVRVIFGGNLIKRFDASGWPGTELIRHTGRVYIVRFNELVKQRMVETENELFKWSNNDRLPEDICVFRSGSKFPVLFSVTHEKEASVLSDKKSIPPGFKESDLPAKYWYIWDGPYFCRLPDKRRRGRSSAR